MDGSSGNFPAQIHPSYYAAIITAEAIGLSSSTRAYEITEALPQTGAFTNISAYAFLEAAVLKRIVLINSDLHMTGDATARRSTDITIDLTNSDTAYKSMSIKRLAIPYVLQTRKLPFIPHLTSNLGILIVLRASDGVIEATRPQVAFQLE